MSRFARESSVLAATAVLPAPPPLEASLRLPAEPGSLAVARHALAGFGAAVGLGPAETADLRLAITESVSTAIRRCGADPRAVVEIEATCDGHALRVTVSDHGEALPIGGELPLPLVAAITDAVELTHLPGGGTAVTLTFELGERLAAVATA